MVRFLLCPLLMPLPRPEATICAPPPELVPAPPEEPAQPDQAFESIQTARRRFEQVYLRALLARTQYNVAKAARVAGVTRQGLYRLLHRNGLGPKRIREEEGDHLRVDKDELNQDG
jgi:DNA-binding NtrC family response regulator